MDGHGNQGRKGLNSPDPPFIPPPMIDKGLGEFGLRDTQTGNSNVESRNKFKVQMRDLYVFIHSGIKHKK